MKYIILIWVSLVSLNALANRELPLTEPLSESSYIALVTCDPGDQLYSLFGHNAIGVVDPEQNLFLIFNYGTFSFNVPFFYTKFASGKLLYKLSYTSYNHFLIEYRREHRRVIEEKLNISQYQKQNIFNLLIENYKPENREYKYDFFFDNCATRISGIFKESLGDTLQYVPSENNEVKTFRNLIDEYLVDSYWSDFGIDIALGSVIDRPATDLEITFLPDYMSEYANYCVINGEPFIKSSRVLVSDTAIFPATPWIVRPQIILWFLLSLVMLLTILLRSKSWIIGDQIIFTSFGITGLVVLLLWVATDHEAMLGNLNILWAHPLYFVFAWLIGSKHKKALKWSSLAILTTNTLVLVGWNIIPQQYHIAFIPFISILIIRSGVITIRNWKY